jgi:hypothetical protein
MFICYRSKSEFLKLTSLQECREKRKINCEFEIRHSCVVSDYGLPARDGAWRNSHLVTASQPRSPYLVK